MLGALLRVARETRDEKSFAWFSSCHRWLNYMLLPDIHLRRMTSKHGKWTTEGIRRCGNSRKLLQGFRLSWSDVEGVQVPTEDCLIEDWNVKVGSDNFTGRKYQNFDTWELNLSKKGFPIATNYVSNAVENFNRSLYALLWHPHIVQCPLIT